MIGHGSHYLDRGRITIAAERSVESYECTGGEPFNNLLADYASVAPAIDFAAHAASLGAIAEHVQGLAELEAALQRAFAAERTSVVVLRTDPRIATAAGGGWWDVGVPEVSARPSVLAARADYEVQRAAQSLGD